jgi:ABC-2 type transport system permease protein
MPIYDRSYKHWDGAFKKRFFRWTPMVGYQLRLLSKKKMLWLIQFMSYVPALITSIFIYIASPEGVAREEVDTLSFVTEGIDEILRSDSEPRHRGPDIMETVERPSIFREDLTLEERYLEISRKGFFIFLLAWQVFFIVLTTSTVGAGLIARDIRSNALEIYLTKPISRVDYVVGKLAVIAAFVFQITFVPSTLVFLVASALWPGYFKAACPILPPLFVACLLVSVVNGLVILALSSITRSSRFATVIWFAWCFLSFLTGTFLRNETHEPIFYLISYRASFEYVFDAIFDAGVMGDFAASDHRLSLVWPIGLIGLYALASILVLRRTVQGAEIRT